jgi:hypothetical protein
MIAADVPDAAVCTRAPLKHDVPPLPPRHCARVADIAASRVTVHGDADERVGAAVGALGELAHAIEPTAMVPVKSLRTTRANCLLVIRAPFVDPETLGRWAVLERIRATEGVRNNEAVNRCRPRVVSSTKGGDVMGLPETMFGRIRIYFQRTFPHRSVEAPNQKLGTDGLGFDDIAIQGKIRDDLNSNEFGFADVLNRQIPRTEFDEDTSLGDVRDFILDNTDMDDVTDYRIKMSERVRIAVRDNVARLAVPPADPRDVLPTDPLSNHFSDATRIGRLQTVLNEELAKYLFRDIPVGALQGLLSAIESRIVDRTIV